ncbi:Nif3-like dinuclear metal center hexameric protein [Achromobacter sp. F4_2707]|uniref:Nif3-like dinuclear metal center hexameric protein n=1 Tax=Achromobacter sp. F4_2707 TaxID=3114286 RepID=UPI0039C63AF9
MNQVSTRQLAEWLDDALQTQRFKDYCPNGLQVEGKDTIRHIITGVTASQALLDAATQQNADAIMVHHGWFWKNENPVLRGAKRQRIATALQHNLNVFGFHLPLDAHPEWGNNAQLARRLGFEPELNDDGTPVNFGPGDLVWRGRCQPCTLEELGRHIERTLGRRPLLLGDPGKQIRTVAWCTGGAQNMMEAAIDCGVDAYITGEASEQNFHMAHESSTAFIAAGHHATERYGIQALGEAIAKQFGIRVDFLDLDNPV